MKRFCIFILLTLTLTFTSFAQGKIKSGKPKMPATQPNKLIGTWRLVEFADVDSATSTWTYAYGKKPNGYFTYTQNGIVNLNISSERPLKISQDSAKGYNINL